MINEDALRRIDDLHRMKGEGIISEEEFEKAKERLLFGGIRREARPFTLPFTQTDVTLPASGDHFGWMTLALRRYADFTGRSTRKEFWMFLLMTNVVAGVLILFAAMNISSYYGAGPLAMFMMVLLCLGFLGVIVPFIAVQVRRFHDQDRSGWFALLNLIPYIGALIVLGFMLLEGTWGENRFGPDPRDDIEPA